MQTTDAKLKGPVNKLHYPRMFSYGVSSVVCIACKYLIYVNTLVYVLHNLEAVELNSLATVLYRFACAVIAKIVFQIWCEYTMHMFM
jgi:hypothetical protein